MKNQFKVKLEDFEKYRPELTRYASGLLRTRGFGNNKPGELDELAKDIVQNTYLTFHNHVDDFYVSEFHLKNFLKMVLYNRYREQFNTKTNNYRYTNGKVSLQDWDGDHPIQQCLDEIDTVEKFVESLSVEQKYLVRKLLKGVTGSELAKHFNISRQAMNDRIKVIRNKYKKYESKNS